MILVKNKIVGINYHTELEASLTECFRYEDEIVLFPWRSCNFQNYVPE